MENKGSELVIGIDIGGTNLKFALINKRGVILKKEKLSTSKIQDKNQFFDSIFQVINNLLSTQESSSDLEGIGIGSPGISLENGVIENASNLPFLRNLNVISVLEKKFDVPVFLIKDSNAAALGEKKYGAAKGMENFILITLGTGLGCAINVNGVLLEGNSGLAGEFGHAIAVENGRECGCGRKGCLETYCSGGGIVRTVFELLANTKTDSILRDLSFRKISSKLIFEAAKKGDPIAIKAFEFTGEILGKKISDLLTLFDPEAIILAGGLAESGDFLLNPINKSIKESVFSYSNRKTRIMFSSLELNEAAQLGAASLVLGNLKINV